MVLEGLGWWPHSNATLPHFLLGVGVTVLIYFCSILLFRAPRQLNPFPFCFVISCFFFGGGASFRVARVTLAKTKQHSQKPFKNVACFLCFSFGGGGGCAFATGKTDWDRYPLPKNKTNKKIAHLTRHKQLVSQNPTKTPPTTKSNKHSSKILFRFVLSFFLILLLLFSPHSSQIQKAMRCWVNIIMSRREDTTQN